MNRIPALLALTLLACGGGDGVDDAVTIEVTFSGEVAAPAGSDAEIAAVDDLPASEVTPPLHVAKLVSEAVESGCTEEALGQLGQAEPEEVRSALLELDKDF